jgi:hypothetical protein
MAGERPGRHADFSSPRGYYLDYSGLMTRDVPVDERGVPLRRLRTGELTHSPDLIARSALGSLERYLESGTSDSRRRFEMLSSWLVDNMEIVPGSFGGWSMPEVPIGLKRHLSPGWFSASAHAECVSVLVRSAVLFRESGARSAADRAFGGFRTSVDDGGFLRELGEAGEEGGLSSLAFMDEYPIQDVALMPLTSHMRSLWAIFDFGRAFESDPARKLLERCVDGLMFVLDQFDLGYWSAADLDARRRARRPASRKRHQTHVVMMESLARMTPGDRIADVAVRWRGYLEDPRNARRAWLERARTAVVNAGAPAVDE